MVKLGRSLLLRPLGLPIVFILYSYALIFFASFISKLPTPELANRSSAIKLPMSKSDVQQLASLLTRYKLVHPNYILALFSMAYIYKQTFAIPGSFFMNLLAGAIYGSGMGLLLVCSLTAIGASMCYSLSYIFGRPIVEYLIPARIKEFREKVAANEQRLFFYMLISRVCPASPNWLINILSPIVGVPWYIFFCSVFLGIDNLSSLNVTNSVGLVPYNFVTVQSGTVLSQIDFNNPLGQNTIWLLAAVSMISLPSAFLYITRKKK